MMKKVRELLKDKRWKWTAGGVACIAAAVVGFSSMSEIGVKADEISLGTETVDLERVSGEDQTYWIETAEQLRKIGNATEGTANLTFKLKNDITFSSITAPAAGTFEGTFDGDGHVIIFEDINITVTDEIESNDSVMNGLVFGSVSGNVEDFVIDIRDTDAVYTRKTKNPAVPVIADPVYEQAQNPIISEKESVTGLSADETELSKVDEIFGLETVSGTEYKTHTLRESGTVTTTYTAADSAEDYFGVVCGNISGTVQEVYLTGNAITVAREELTTLEYSQSVQSGYREEAYYYLQETDSRTEEGKDENVSLPGTIFAIDKTYTQEMRDQGISANVSVEKAAAKGAVIAYQVTVFNQEDKNYTINEILTSKEGRWNETFPVEVPTGSSKDLYFYYETANVTEDEILMDFTVKGNSDHTTIMAKISASPVQLFETDDGMDKQSKQGLKLYVSAPSVVEKGKDIQYQVTLTNAGNEAYDQVTLQAAEAQGTWSETKDLELLAGEQKIVTFTYKKENVAADQILMNFIAEGKNTATEEAVKTIVSNVSTQILEITKKDWTAESKGLLLKVSAENAKQITGTNPKVSYIISVTNTSDVSYENVNITSSKAGKWQHGKPYQDTDTFKIETLSANETFTTELTYGYSKDESDAKEIIAAFAAEYTANGEFTKVDVKDVVTQLFDKNVQTTKISQQGLQLDVSAPKAAQKGDVVACAVTVTNLSNNPFENVQLEMNVNGTSEEKHQEQFLLGANENKELVFYYSADTDAAEVVLNFRAIGTSKVLTENGEAQESESITTMVSDVRIPLLDSTTQDPEASLDDLKMIVYAPTEVKKGETIEYRVKVINTGTLACKDLTVTASVNGEWSNEGDSFDLEENDHKELIFKYKPHNYTREGKVTFNLSGNFEATEEELGKVEREKVSVNVAELTTTVFDSSEMNKDSIGEELILDVSAPKAVKKGENIVYTVNLKSVGSRELGKIKVTANVENGESETGWSGENPVLLVDGSGSLKYTYKPSEDEEQVALVFTAEEIVEPEVTPEITPTPTPEEELALDMDPAKVSVTSEITTIFDAGLQKPTIPEGDVKVEISAPKAIRLGEALTYQLIVTNESDRTIEDLNVRSSLEGGTWDITQPFSLESGNYETLNYVYTPTAEQILAGVSFSVDGKYALTEEEKDAVPGARIRLNVENVVTTITDASMSDLEALQQGLYVKVSAAGEIAKGDSLVYTVYLKNTSTKDYNNILISSTREGNWQPSNNVSVKAGKDKTVQFTVDTSSLEQETVLTQFSVSAKQGDSEDGIAIDFTALETKLYDVSSKDKENVMEGLTLNVLAQNQAGAKAGDQIHYILTIGNTSQKDFENIQLTSTRTGEWIRENAKTTASVFEIAKLPAGSFETIEFVVELKRDDITNKVVLTDFTAEGSVDTSKTKVVVSEVETKLFDSEELSEGESEQGLTLQIQAPKAAKKGGEIEYQVTITNMSNAAYSDIVLNTSKEGSWKEKNTFALLKDEVKVLTFVTTAGAGEEEVVDFSVTANNTDTSEEVKVKVSGVAVQLIDASVVPMEQKVPGMELKIEAPQAQREETSPSVEYRITVTNTSDQDYSGVIVSANKKGDWNNEGINEEAFEIETIEKGTSAVVTFISEISNQELEANEVSFVCTVSNVTGDVSVDIESPEIKTKLLETKAEQVEVEVANGLKATLQLDDSNVLEGENFQYTLILENTNSLTKRFSIAKNIQILTELAKEGWVLESSDAQEFSVEDTAKQVLEVGQKVTLKKTVTESVKGNGVSNVYIEALKLTSALTEKAYKYTYDSEVKAPVFNEFVADENAPVNSGIAIISGNTLYAGGVAGQANGTVSKIKLEVDMAGNVDDEMVLGGIAGKTNNPSGWSSIYMLGKVNDLPKYAGAGNVLPGDSATSVDEAQAMVGKEAWATYKKYVMDGENFEEQAFVDLAWLIKTETASDVYFSFSEPESKSINVLIDDSKKLTNQELSYVVAYNARRSMNDATESSVYKSMNGTMELGTSGYYRLLSAYATDGYYHYNIPEVALEEAEWIYPYHEEKHQNPYVIAEQRVVRSATNPLEDQIQIHFADTTDGILYYEGTFLDVIPNMGAESNTEQVNIDSEGNANLPFMIDRIRYRIVPVIDGHIYPTLTTKEFSQSDKQPLPKPIVTCYDYYDINGNKKEYVAFGAASYEAGTDMRLIPAEDEINNESYSFRYAYSTSAPMGEWNEEQRYLGNDISFMNQAVDYLDSAVIPEELAGQKQVYLYVEMAKKNYDPQYYYFGPFEVTQGDKLNASVISNGEVIEGYSLLDGDTVVISSSLENADIQYAISAIPADTFDWKEYQTAGITMKQNQGGYVYARIKYSEEKYSKETLFDYTFGGICADPRVTPNTGVSSSGADAAATIGAATNVTLSSRTPNAEIFYMVSDTTQMLTMERALNLPADVTADGQIGSDDYKYFKVGSRWYRTAYTETERYSEGIVLSHGKKDAQLMYLSTVALADGYDSSAVLEYVYKVQPVQQVSNPEGAFDTRHMPGGESTEVSSVALGAHISFFSVTPEAKLYYEIGSGTEAPTKEMPVDGIVVEGNYGGNFVVRVQAKKDGMLDSEIVTFVYSISDQELASAPTATPGTSDDVPTTVIPGNKILLSTVTKEASIFYTTDGSSPKVVENEDGTFTAGNENTKLYDPNAGIVMPMDGSGYFSITAVTTKTGLAKSEEVHFIYIYPGAVLKPYANIDSGKVDLNSSVILKNLTEGAVIYYTVAYADQQPEDPTLSSSVFSEAYPFTITQKTTIKAIAAKNGVKSEVATFVYEPMDRLAAPEASVVSGSIVSRGTVLELKSVSGATIYYTMDGSDPTDKQNGAVMSGNILTLNGEAGSQLTIKAYAFAENQSPSEVATFTYQFSQNAGGVTASIESGSLVSNGTKVNLMSDVSDAEIYYTTDSSSPIDKGRKGTIVEINGTPGSSFTIKAVAIANDTPGTVATFIYKIKERPTEPAASPAGGTLTVATRVSLSSSAEKIYYTTDGTEPTKSSALYSEPILINRSTVLKAIAVSEDGEVSEVSTFVYTAAGRAAKVEADQEDGVTLLPGTEVKLSTDTENAVIYYSTDGTEPTMDNLDSMLVYDGESLEINRSVTIQAVAYREDLRLSSVAIWTYTVDIIPGEQLKESEEAKKAEEGLRDTDASNLDRKTDAPDEVNTRMLRENVNDTRVSYQQGVLPEQLKLETIKEENSPLAVEKAKGILGEDNTVLETYQFKVKNGTTPVQPNGKVEIAIPIPEGYEDAALTIAYVEEGHNLTTLETRREIGTLYAKTMKLGSYVIIGPERQETEESRLPYLIILEIAAGLALVGGLFFLVKEKLKKRRKKK